MLNDNSLKKLKKDGFVIINTKSRKKLEKVRFKVFRILISELKNKRINHNIEDIEFLFNNFHKLKINDSDLNSIRVNLIKKLNKNEKIIEDLYKIFNHDLKKMLGLDIVGQRKVNLVIQKPNDKSVAPIHRDSPPNSPHEIVFWLPLVNCYKTKSINILESKFTDQVNKMFNSKKINYKKN
jgi:sporadic carbohydrate cluster 2OG-Fe(II) oxygenase